MINKNSINLKYKGIIVTGANGFTGRYVCKRLISKGIKFSVILRPGTNTNWFSNRNIKTFYGDLNNHEDISNIFRNFECLINIASLGFGSAQSIIKASEKNSLKRTIFISSTSIYTLLNAKSKSVRMEAEDLIKKSKLNWTIIRPTMIYGSPKDRNMIKLIKWIDKVKILPIFGQGNSLQQPVNVKDLAWFIVAVIDKNEAFRNEFNISGKEPITFNQIVIQISKNLHRNPIKIYLPKIIFSRIFYFFEFLNIKLPIKSEQINRLNEDKVFSHHKATCLIGYNPMSFKQGILREIEIYKNKNNNI